MDNPKPDPDCRWCRGTGEVVLAVTTVPCDCIKAIGLVPIGEEEIRLAEEDDGLGTTDTGCHI